MKLETFKNKKILIVGNGVEGQAAFLYLKKRFPKNTITVVDKKTDGEDYLSKQKEYDIAVKTPSVPKKLLTIPYTTTMNIFFANAKGKIIGITGTKGKSTTTSLIYEMLKKSAHLRRSAAEALARKRQGFGGQGKNVYLGGNIGNSPLEFLDTLDDQSWTVLELSSFQLQDLAYSPHIAVLLMITSEHLDIHKDFSEYLGAKRNILRFQKHSDYAVINRDYPPAHESDIYTDAKIFQVSRERACDQGCYVKDNAIWIREDEKEERIIDSKEVQLLGGHNLENACAAVMAAVLAGVKKEHIVSVLKTFQGLEHRLEFVGEYDGVRFYNDTLATLPQATIEALEALPETETLIAGGYDRGLDYDDLGRYIATRSIKILILFSPTGEKIWEGVCKAAVSETRPEKFVVTSMEQAVRIAKAETSPGKVCLMSPASASFGIFKNYKDRGEQFKREVGKLPLA